MRYTSSLFATALLLLACVATLGSAQQVVVDTAPFFDPTVASELPHPETRQLQEELRSLGGMVLGRHGNYEDDEEKDDYPYHGEGGEPPHGGPYGKGKGYKKGSKKKGYKKGKGTYGKGKGKGDDHGGGYYPSPCKCDGWDYDWCDCGGEPGDLPPLKFELALVREEIGTDAGSVSDFTVASTVAINGRIMPIVGVDANGHPELGESPNGSFKGVCTATSNYNSILYCAYELFVTTFAGRGVILTRGHVMGADNIGIVAGTGFDFQDYTMGTIRTTQNDEKPVLYVNLVLKEGKHYKEDYH